jgi:4-diphosphocytidyl-2-C-methyl-D-erythritol kinase
LQSGLGGSSTDAACVMNYLHSINKHSPLDYQDIAMNLGSDIPFFLSKYDKALVKGYGNVVSQYKKATPNYKVIITNAPSNTKQIYSALTKDKCFHSQIQFMKLTGSLANLTSKQIYNDLEKYVIQVHPQLQKTLTKTKQGGICFFSGSGGSIIQLQNGKNIS